MRHLALAYPGDPRATGAEDAFLFGPDLLAAPVLDPGRASAPCTCRAGAGSTCGARPRYRKSDGGLALGRARVLRGGRTVTVPAPLGELPLLARAGTLLSLLPPDVDTLASYGDAAPAVSLAERAGERVLLAFPRGRSAARLEHGGGLRSREESGRWKLGIRAERRTRWALQASLGTLRRPFTPCSLRLDGRRLPASAWSHNAATRVLRARFTTRAGELVASACSRR